MNEASQAPSPALANVAPPVPTTRSIEALRASASQLGSTAQLDPRVAERFRHSLNERLTHSVDGLPRNTLPGIGDSVDTRGRFQHVVVQVRDANGQFHTECVENKTQLERVLRSGVAK